MRSGFATRQTPIPRPPMDCLGPKPDYLWERRGLALAGWGTAAAMEVEPGEALFARAAAFLAEEFAGAEKEAGAFGYGSGPVAFASFTFDPEAPGSRVAIPQFVIGAAGEAAWTVTHGRTLPAWSVPAAEPGGKIRYAGSTVEEMAWLDAVDEAIRLVRQTSLEKVVLARDVKVWSEHELDPRTLAHRLVRRFPECLVFLCDGLLGATPELLVRRRGKNVESLVLAGSIKRGSTPSEDAMLGDSLAGSSKDAAEHAPAVESVVSALRIRCRSVEADREPWLLKLANLQHLATRVRAELSEPMTALELAGLLHPTAAVCGTPTADAMDVIRRLEVMDRGRYAGPVGWVDAGGDGEFGIALRCAEINGNRARLFAGGGIVEGSVPEDELEETRLKLRAMQSALEGKH